MRIGPLHRLSNLRSTGRLMPLRSHRLTIETSSIQTVPSSLLSNFRDRRRKAWISRRRVGRGTVNVVSTTVKDAEANSLIGGDSLGTDLSPKAMSSWLHDDPLREVAVVHVFRPAESDSQRPGTRLEDFGIARRLKLPRDYETTR